eukprot:scaffold23548_cov81-Phaeocystis_antarctica.AAC.2
MRHTADFSFDEIVNAARVPRSTSHNPLAQTSCVYHAAQTVEEDRAAYEAATVPSEAAVQEQQESAGHARGAKVSFDLAVYFQDGEGGGLQGMLAYDGALFEEATAERMMAGLVAFVRAAVEAPGLALRRLPIMAGVESELVLRGSNQTAAPFPAELCVHELVAAQAARTPDAVALEWRGDTMSYAELHASAARVAAWLAAGGVAPDGVVALQLHRSLEQVVGVYGVLLSGGAYLPLDPKWPLARRRFMVEDAACGWLVAQSAHAAEYAGWFGGAVLELDDARCVPEPAAAAVVGLGVASAARVRPHHLAYVIYTSGSTGKPKGVLVEHGGVVNLLYGIQSQYSAAANLTFGLSTSYTFDPFVRKLFICLGILGGTCKLLADSTELLSLSPTEHVTHLGDVPSVMALARIPPSVKHVEVAGETLSQFTVDNMPTGVVLYNNYGPTEMTVDVTARCVTDPDLPSRLASIGKPLPNVTCYVVDPTSPTAPQAPPLQPIGVWGELWLGG